MSNSFPLPAMLDEELNPLDEEILDLELTSEDEPEDEESEDAPPENESDDEEPSEDASEEEDPGELPPPVPPRERGDCLPGGCNELRPCPWTRCEYNLPNDSASCVLDIADQGGTTLEAVGAILGLTRERIRQIEFAALRKLERHHALRLFRG